MDQGRAGAKDTRRSDALAHVVLAALALCMNAANVHAQTPAAYPQRPMRIVIPFAPGGNADIMARVVGQKLSERLGQQVIIDNRGGANSIIGTEIAAKAPADGYTLVFISNLFATNVVFAGKLPYDAIKDFAPLSLTASTPLLLVVNNGLPVKSVKELIALAKSRPGALNYGSSGNGATANLAGELFNYMAGVNIVHVPYKGTAQATTDLIGGQMQVGYPSISSVLPHVRVGKLRALGMTGAQRSALAPDVPTVAESGVPGYEASIWTGVAAPAGMPKAIIERLNRDIIALVRAPETLERLAALGSDPLTSTPGEFAVLIKADIARWAKLAQASGLHFDLAR
jgi:tripartite-type tricarboxylate transporter receptor subunit TctC